jgi:NADPH:quinone reductase-like Zn-dependent oxidoreductase
VRRAGSVQLAKRRGAKIVAITSRSKIDQLLELGADEVVERDEDLAMRLGESSIDVVVDNVAGPNFAQMLQGVKIRRVLRFVGCDCWSRSELGHARYVSQRHFPNWVHGMGCFCVSNPGILYRK